MKSTARSALSPVLKGINLISGVILGKIRFKQILLTFSSNPSLIGIPGIPVGKFVFLTAFTPSKIIPPLVLAKAHIVRARFSFFGKSSLYSTLSPSVICWLQKFLISLKLILDFSNVKSDLPNFIQSIFVIR